MEANRNTGESKKLYNSEWKKGIAYTFVIIDVETIQKFKII